MRAHFIDIEALDAAGYRQHVQLTSFDDRRACHFLGGTWMPAIEKLPALAYDFFGGDFAGRIETPTGSFTAAVSGLPDLSSTRYSGARVQIWQSEFREDAVSISDYKTRFDGKITAEPTIEAGIATFSIRPNDAWLDKPLLSLFAGTGGAEGPDELEGTVKPLALGVSRFAPGTLIDAVDLVYRVSAYGPIEGVTAVYDRVVSLGLSSGDHPDLAALLAANIAAGTWATCNALGLVRLGAPADGQISFQISGDKAGSGGFVRKPGAIIGRIAEIAGGTVDPAHLAALDAARPWNLSLMLIAQTTAREVIQELSDSICAVAGITHLGQLFVTPLGLSEPTLTLNTDGSTLPSVEDVSCQAISEPYWRLATNAELTWVVHASSDVGTQYVIRGRWNALRVYRLDDLVDMEDGSVWVYISETPQAGITPGSDPAVWQFQSGPLAASYTAQLSQDSHTVAATSDGTVPSFAGAGGTFSVTDPSGAVVPGFAFSLVEATGVTIEIDAGTGVYAVTAMSADSGTAKLRAVKDDIQFEKTYSIAKAIAGQSAMNASALPAAVTVASTYNGTPKAGIPGFTVKCFLGEVDVTTDALGGFTSDGLTGVVHTGGGVFTVAGMSADTGYVEVEFSFGGAGTVLRVPYSKSKDGAPYVTGSSNVGAPTSTTYAEAARVTLLMGPSGTIEIDANGGFAKSGGGTISIDGYFEVSLNGGGSWASVGTGLTVTPAVGIDEGSYEANSGTSGSSIGLTSSQTVDVRLMLRKTNTTAFSSFGGSMAVSWHG